MVEMSEVREQIKMIGGDRKRGEFLCQLVLESEGEKIPHLYKPMAIYALHYFGHKAKALEFGQKSGYSVEQIKYLCWIGDEKIERYCHFPVK